MIRRKDLTFHKELGVGRGLHSFTSQLNLSTFCWIGGALRGCVAHVEGL